MEISNDKMFDILSGINGQLTSLNGNMQTVLEKLSIHEHRLSQHDAELKEIKDGKYSSKDTIISLLIKGLLAAILIIGSLTGASTIIAKSLGVAIEQQTTQQGK